MYTRMLIPLDGSKVAEQVLPYARFLANTLSLPVELLQAVDPEAIATDIVEFEEPAVEPLAFNPEAKNPIEHVDLAPKAEISMPDRILQSIYGK